jgi:hypothetical protein
MSKYIALIILISCTVLQGFSQVISKTRVEGNERGTYDVEAYGDTLIYAGGFSKLGLPMNDFTILDKSHKLANHDFVNRGAEASMIISDQKGGYYVAGGDFHIYEDNQTYEGLIHINPDATLDRNFKLSVDPLHYGDIAYIALDADTIYLGGEYGVYKYDAITGTKYDNWSSPAQNVRNFFTDDKHLYFAGFDHLVGGTENRYQLSRIDKRTGEQVPTSLGYTNSETSNAMVDADSLIITSGNFAKNNFAVIEFETPMSNDEFEFPFPNIFDNKNDVVRNISFDGEHYYISGKFEVPYTNAQGKGGVIINLLRLNSDMSLDTTFHPFSNFEGQIPELSKLSRYSNTLYASNFNNSTQAMERLYKIDVVTKQIDENFSYVAYSDIFRIEHISSDTAVLIEKSGKLVLLVNDIKHTFPVSLGNISVKDFAINEHNSNLIYLAGYDKQSFTGEFFRIDLATNNIDPTYDVGVSGIPQKIEIKNDTLYISGSIGTVNNEVRSQFAAISAVDATVFQPSYSSVTKAVFDFNFYQDNIVFRFIDGSAMHSRLNGEPTGWSFNHETNIYGYATVGNNIYLSGSISNTNQLGLGLYKLKKDSLLSFAGSPFVTLDAMANRINDILLENNGVITFTGSYNQVNGEEHRGIAKVTLEDGSLLNWEMDPSIAPTSFTALHLFQDTLYAVNNDSLFAMSNQNGECYWRIAIDGASVRDIFIDNKHIVIAGRELVSANVKEANQIMGYVPSTGEYYPLNIELGSWQNKIYALKVVDNTLYFGGDFSEVNGEDMYRWGQYDLVNKSIITPSANYDVQGHSEVTDIEFDDKFIYFSGPSGVHAVSRNGSTVNESFLSFDNPRSYLSDIKLVKGSDAVFVVGPFININSATQPYFNVARLNNGALDPDWRLTNLNTSYQNSFVSDLEQTSDYTYVSGDFKYSGLNTVHRLSRLNQQTKKWDATFNPTFNGDVQAIDISGGRLFATGDFSDVNDFNSGALAEVNLNYGFSELLNLPLESGNEVEIFKDKLFLFGGYAEGGIERHFARSLLTYNLDPTIHNYRVEKIEPSQGSNLALVTATITGLGFEPGSSVILRQSGVELNFGTGKAFVENRFIQTQLDFTAGHPLGFYDVVVKRKNGEELVLKNGFELIEYKNPIYFADLVGQNAIGKDFWQEYTVIVKNESAHDIFAVPVNLALDKDAQVNIYGNYFVTGTTNDTLYITKKTIANIPVDSIGSKPFDGMVYSAIVPLLPAKSETQLSYNVLHHEENPDNQVVVWTDRALSKNSDSLKAQVKDCFQLLITDKYAENFNDSSCVYNGLMDQLRGTKMVLDSAMYRLYLSGFGQGRSNGYGHAFQDLNASLDSIASICSEDVTAIKNIFKTAWNANPMDSLNLHCATPFFPQALDFKNIPVVASIDPNDKTGPLGLFSKGILTNSEKINYRIRFENDSTATAPARLVTILDTLDATVFDTNSVIFKDVKFGEFEYHAAPNASFIDDKIDLRPNFNVIAHISASVKAGVIRWVITALDPSSLETSQNPFDGFLPPNFNSPEGQGSVFFNVSLKSPIPDNLEIKNKASIIFDFNEEIPTNTFVNLIDKIDPVSTIGSLPAQTNDSTFYIPIDGFDNESGILYYMVYASKDNGAYHYIGSTALDSIYFEGQNNSIYNFYSIATDSAGNVEDKIVASEALIKIGGTTGITNSPNEIAYRLYPNPTNGSIKLEIPDASAAVIKYVLYSAQGTMLLQQSVGKPKSLNLDISHLETGIYLLQIHDENGKTSVRRISKK